MLRSTFQIVPGIGPGRERKLWQAGLLDWAALGAGPNAGGFLPGTLAAELRLAAQRLESAATAGDLARLASHLPPREHWRLFAAFGAEAVYLDIETDEEEGITAIGLLDAQGPRLLLGGRDAHLFPEVMAGVRFLVTYNGSSFDVPVLRRHFPDWTPPPVHVDLCHLWRRLGARGGLKVLEESQGLGRPAHLKGLHGLDAVWLWRRARNGDQDALRRFAEYNLYDTINLRTLMALGYNRMLERLQAPGEPLAVSHRGDVLYDVSKILLAL